MSGVKCAFQLTFFYVRPFHIKSVLSWTKTANTIQNDSKTFGDEEQAQKSKFMVVRIYATDQ